MKNKNRVDEDVLMVRIILFLLLSIVMPLYGGDNNMSDWTWIYRRTFDEKLRKAHENKKVILFEQFDVPYFTQLIFSWNVLRPSQGYFSFYVQVRNAQTKKWGTWHHMADWGKGIQKSFLSKSDGFSSHVYVRLEIDNKKNADAFRVKIKPHNDACLSSVCGICVAASNFNIFKAEPVSTARQLSSVHITGVPSIAQLALDHEDKTRICSPTSCSMVVHYLTGTYKDPLEFATNAFDAGLGVYGSWPCNVAHAFECCNGSIHFFVRRMNSFVDLHKQLAQGIPVVVSVRGTLPGAYKSFPHGHLMVVVGYDNQTGEVLCHDPACESNDAVFKRYPLEHFLRAWENSHRLAYVAEFINAVAAID